jgi:hypothetical protein
MEAFEILDALPDHLGWMVLFKLSTFRRWARDSQLKQMFHLSDAVELTELSHVVLSSHGRMGAALDSQAVMALDNKGLTQTPAEGASLLDRHRRFFDAGVQDRVDCLGFAYSSDATPVLVSVSIEGEYGHGRALFSRAPSRKHYELLKAIGVEYIEGHATESGYVAVYRNRLSRHLQAGALADYSRTSNCSRFFRNQGRIDAKVKAGLLKAARDRIQWAVRQGLEALRKLAAEATGRELAMTCQPPPPGKAYPYGDLVPLGFLLKALKELLPNDPAREGVIHKLELARRGNLWSFHTGKLVTAIDSALILQGLGDRRGIEELERFADGHGGYVPQLWSRSKQRGHMLWTEARDHWCQADLGTTCWVRALRADAGLGSVTSLDYLTERFDSRAGLYFANPYLTDWAFACSIERDEAAGHLRARLRQEILASINADYSFGTYDVALSTGLAILALAALGYRGRLLGLAQLALLDLMASQAVGPESVPFYSSSKLPEARAESQGRSKGAESLPSQVVDVGGTMHEVSLYRDTHRMVSTAVAVLALNQTCNDRESDALQEKTLAHPRYRCASVLDYVREFALPPYAGHGL